MPNQALRNSQLIEFEHVVAGQSVKLQTLLDVESY